VGSRSSATGQRSVGIGHLGRATAIYATAIGGEAQASASYSIAIGEAVSASSQSAIAIGGYTAGGNATAINAVALNQNATLRGQLSTRPFQAVYWGGQTTNNTATILNLDATATNRFTIAANTALAVDVLLVARRSDTADKWLVARRFLGIRRDGSNNTSLIGSVQTLGTDQSGGSPTWSFTLTADDTNEALQLEVTGAASETVQWRATAFYRVV
jgi:phage gp37-like protein